MTVNETTTPSGFSETSKQLRQLFALMTQTAHYILRGRVNWTHTFAQMYAVGNRSLFFMFVTMGFIGAIITYQTGLQALKLVPDFSTLGGSFIKLLVRDMAVSLGALPLATRVGAGIAAEIGSMVVTDQVDALRMSSADPVEYLVVPRFIACVTMSVVLLLLGGAVAMGTGLAIAAFVFHVSVPTFVNLGLVHLGDLSLALIKAITYGAAIALVSSERGLATFGGSEGVGIATTEAVVGSCFSIILLNLFLSSAGYFVFPA